jgi:hypothetical protein
MKVTGAQALFKSLESGPIPDGPAKGTAIIAPGSSFNDELAEFYSDRFRDEFPVFDRPALSDAVSSPTGKIFAVEEVNTGVRAAMTGAAGSQS